MNPDFWPIRIRTQEKKVQSGSETLVISLIWNRWPGTFVECQLGGGHNVRLDGAWREREGKGPILLYFSVNGSGHFCGMAQMLSGVDYNSSAGVWAQDKWKGRAESIAHSGCQQCCRQCCGSDQLRVFFLTVLTIVYWSHPSYEDKIIFCTSNGFLKFTFNVGTNEENSVKNLYFFF